jgi:hypothetical protein
MRRMVYLSSLDHIVFAAVEPLPAACGCQSVRKQKPPSSWSSHCKTIAS